MDELKLKFEKLKRERERIALSYAGDKTVENMSLQDHFTNFCKESDDLKDYLVNDPRCYKGKKKKVDVRASVYEATYKDELLCATVVISVNAKHKNFRKDFKESIKAHHDNFQIEFTPTQHVSSFVSGPKGKVNQKSKAGLRVNGRQWDMLEMADETIARWNQIIVTHGIAF